jgi:hypothetical protein
LGSKTIQQEARSEDFRIDDVQALAAEKGFGVLGTNAEPAIPRMLKLLENEETTSRAAEALALVGPKGFGALTNYLATGKMRGSVIVALGQRGGGDPKVVTQILINALKYDPEIADNAAMFLVGKDPAVAVPVLIQALDDKGAATRQWAAYALGSYGPAAKEAAPKLLSLYTNHQDEAGLVFEALKKIDRDTTAKAEEFTVNSGPLGARAEYTRTLLKNGKELIAGGYINTKVLAISKRFLSKAELMDPKTGNWTETGEMNVARCGHRATLLNDSRVLVAGGSDGKGHDLSSAELYDPATGKWTLTGSLNAPHDLGSMVLLPDGKVLIYSGGANGYPRRDQELYDPTTVTWTVATPSAISVYALKYDPSTETWTAVTNQTGKSK